MDAGANNIPQKCCLNCHFLVEYKLRPGSFGSPVSKQYRTEILSDPTARDNKLEKRFQACACYMGVWSPATTIEEAKEDLGNRDWDRVVRERGESCFFWPHDNRLSIEAARELERREADRREAKQDRKWAKIGVWVAAIALIANLLWSVYQHFNPPATASPQTAAPTSKSSPPSGP